MRRKFKEIGLIISDEGEWDAYYGTGNEALLELLGAGHPPKAVTTTRGGGVEVAAAARSLTLATRGHPE